MENDQVKGLQQASICYCNAVDGVCLTNPEPQASWHRSHEQKLRLALALSVRDHRVAREKRRGVVSPRSNTFIPLTLYHLLTLVFSDSQALNDHCSPAKASSSISDLPLPQDLEKHCMHTISNQALPGTWVNICVQSCIKRSLELSLKSYSFLCILVNWQVCYTSWTMLQSLRDFYNNIWSLRAIYREKKVSLLVFRKTFIFVNTFWYLRRIVEDLHSVVACIIEKRWK